MTQPSSEEPQAQQRQVTNLKDALSALDAIAQESTFNVVIPSLKKEIIFRELNTKQQKELIQSIVDSPFYRTKFITTIYKIIKENYLAIPGEAYSGAIDSFDVLDKQLILLKMRAVCFSPAYEVVTDENVEKKWIDIAELYEKACTTVTPAPSSVSDGNIAIQLKLPTIGTEYTLEEELHKNIDVLDVNSSDTLRSTLGDLFIGELSKYVVSVVINDKIIDFSGMKFVDRIKVLEKIPNKLIQQVIDYIDNTKKIIDSITTVTLKEKETGREIQEKIDIDGSFFAK